VVCRPSADAAPKRSRIFVLVQDRGFNCDGPMQGDAMSRNRIGMLVFYTLEICLAKCVPALCRVMQLRRPNAGGRDLEKSQSCEKCCVSLTTFVAQSFPPSFCRGPRVPVDSKVKCAPPMFGRTNLAGEFVCFAFSGCALTLGGEFHFTLCCCVCCFVCVRFGG
jgi:hypothetical protein